MIILLLVPVAPLAIPALENAVEVAMLLVANPHALGCGMCIVGYFLLWLPPARDWFEGREPPRAAERPVVTPAPTASRAADVATATVPTRPAASGCAASLTEMEELALQPKSVS